MLIFSYPSRSILLLYLVREMHEHVYLLLHDTRCCHIWRNLYFILCTASVGKLVAFAAIKGNSKGAQVAANKRPPLQMTNLL